MKLDVDRLILEAAGKPVTTIRDSHIRVAAKLKRLGASITHHAIHKWHQRQTIQGSNMTAMAVLAREEGRKMDLTQYIVN